MQRTLKHPMAVVALTACGHALHGVAPAAGQGTGAETCEGHVFVPVNGGRYVVQTNEWNSRDPQCLSVAGDGAFTIMRADFDLPVHGGPATYPSIFRGCHWGTCTAGSGMPLLVASLPAVTSSWTVTVPDGAAYDVAYDIWFNKTPEARGAPDGAELMIWLDHDGGIGSAGTWTGTVTLQGATWGVWQAPVGAWKYIAYLRTEPTHAVRDLDIRAFILDAVARGAIERSSYLIGVEAGFEVWRGGRGFESRSFQVDVGAR